jgi:hypothetical protein
MSEQHKFHNTRRRRTAGCMYSEREKNYAQMVCGKPTPHDHTTQTVETKTSKKATAERTPGQLLAVLSLLVVGYSRRPNCPTASRPQALHGTARGTATATATCKHRHMDRPAQTMCTGRVTHH